MLPQFLPHSKALEPSHTRSCRGVGKQGSWPDVRCCYMAPGLGILHGLAVKENLRSFTTRGVRSQQGMLQFKAARDNNQHNDDLSL